MEPEPEKGRRERPPPRLLVRLAIWCGIYLCAAISGAVLFMRATGDGKFIEFLQVVVFSIISFPCWLGFPFVPRYGAAATMAALLDSTCATAYILYVVALWFTWNVKTRHAFRNVMLGFVALVLLNLISCHELTRRNDTPDEFNPVHVER